MHHLFSWIYKVTTGRPKLVLGLALIFTIFMGWFASSLRMELNWVGLTPAGDPSVKEYEKIMDDFPAMSNILVMVEANDDANLDQAVQSTEHVLNELDQYVHSVTAAVDPVFLREKGLLLTKSEEIELTGMMLADPNLNAFIKNTTNAYDMQTQALEKKDLQAATTNEKLTESADITAAQLRGMNVFFQVINEQLQGGKSNLDMRDGVNRLMFGDPYFRSSDGSRVLLTVQPTFSMTDYEQVTPGVEAILAALADVEADMPGVSVKATGMHVVAKDEMESVESDSYVTTVAGILFILVLLYVVFRMFTAPLLAFVPLIFGVIWDVGLASLTIGRLNMMTAFTAIMLIGLGIDFSIHLLSAYTEAKGKGTAPKAAIQNALLNVGPSIFTGAMTTAFAFLALSISSLQVLSELGLVMGMGIITTIAAVFFILPALLTFDKGKAKRSKKVRTEFISLGRTASFSHKHKVFTSLIIISLAVVMGWQGSKLTFDLNMMNLEPEGLASIENMEELVDNFGMSTEGFLVEKDRLEDVYALQKELENAPNVSSVMSIASILPKKEIQEERLAKIESLKPIVENQAPLHDVESVELQLELESLMDALKELANIYEESSINKVSYAIEELTDESTSQIERLIDQLEAGNVSQAAISKTAASFYHELTELSKDMLATEPITVSSLPENYKTQLVSPDEKHFLLSVYPDFEMWEALGTEKGKDFIKMLREKDASFTGTPIFMRVLYDAAKSEVVKTGLIALGILFLILFLHFRSVKFVLISFTPLVLTLIFTTGTMNLLGLQWNILNVLALPLIIGIGIDDGVHVLHRYKTSNDSIQEVFSSIGRAISITSLTTMAGFGSLMFSSYRGIAYLGQVLFIGVGYAFLFSILVIPLFLKERRK